MARAFVMPGIPADIQLSNDEWDDILRQADEILDPFKEEIECECGAEAVYGPDSPGHASYCPKAED